MTVDAVGGVWDYAIELALGLAPAGVEVMFACMGPRPNQAQRRHALKLGNLSLAESAFRLEWMEDFRKDASSGGKWLLELERVWMPDLIQINGYCHAALRWRAPTVLVAHSCVASWWKAVRGTGLPPAWNQYSQAVKRGLRSANAVIAPSGAMLANLREEYGWEGGGIVIHNGRTRRSSDRMAKQEYILTVGRLWDEAKNIAALDEIAARLAWPVYAAGDISSPGGGIVAPIHIRTLGRLDSEELELWYANAAIYALPARYEPFGLSILEAALSGCALVLGDIPSLRELWDGAARFVAPADARQLGKAITSLIELPGTRRLLAEQARMRASRLTRERMADGYLEAYSGVLCGTKPRHEAPRALSPAD
ncbi:MAG: glycosyltransferase family 4 protein [Candidatus Binataceae bacterium]